MFLRYKILEPGHLIPLDNNLSLTYTCRIYDTHFIKDIDYGSLPFNVRIIEKIVDIYIAQKQNVPRNILRAHLFIWYGVTRFKQLSLEKQRQILYNVRLDALSRYFRDKELHAKYERCILREIERI